MYNDILSLQETSANNWLAKYIGNYGTYTIKVEMRGTKAINFSCSCPSEYYPCKHIAIIKEAILQCIAEEKESRKEKPVTIEKLLQNISHKELIDFVIQHARYDPEFEDKMLLEFLHKSPAKQKNNYNAVLQKALSKVHFDLDDLYDLHEDALTIDILDEWIAKAALLISQKRFEEAISICKACIEEYAEWMEEADDDIREYLDPGYQKQPFELLKEIVLKHVVNKNELFQYCTAEATKTKYLGTDLQDGFNDLLAELAGTVNAQEFISLQDKLLKNVANKSSREAEKILERKIQFYKKNNQEKIAWQLVWDNIQIESFRKQVVEQKIVDRKFSEAKKLIADFLSSRQSDNFFSHQKWNALSLAIAQKERDIPLIRKISFVFIENHFEAAYYRIYKSTFKPGEWKIELKEIIEHYEKKGKYFSDSVAEVLAEEKDAAGLMGYIAKHLSAERMSNYHKHFASAYPEQTLHLFEKAVNQYAAKNTGRTYYDYIVQLLKNMLRIEGGKEVVASMITQYKDQYKNRSAMIEILNKVRW